jgi:RNA polymerase sigma factor (sigma-70 family)
MTSPTADGGDSESSAAPGVSAYLAKPVGCERLLEMMKSIGMYWMLLDKTHPGVGHPGVSLQSRHVLVVDRDADFLRSVGEALHRRTPPLVVDPALNSEDALRRLAQTSPAALVYERGLEGSEECGFFCKARAIKADLPVIIVCAESDEAFATRAMEKGVTGIVLKKVRQDQFSDELHGLLVTATNLKVPVASAAPKPEPARDSRGAVSDRTPKKGTGSGRRQDTDILGNQIAFQNTKWDLVRAAPKTEALDALIRIYWKPLYFFVRQQGFGNEEAKDIVQEFLASALQRGMIPRADPLRGRFRTFLLSALTNFLRDRHRSGGRLKRGGGHAPVSLAQFEVEPRYARAVHTGEPPQTIIDRKWAKGFLGQCISELEGKPSHLQAFELQMQGMDYMRIAKATGLSQTAAKTAVHRLRIRLRGIIRSHLRLENATDEEVGREVAELASLLA